MRFPMNRCLIAAAPWTFPAVFLAFASGCASTTPAELVDARSAYDLASKGPAAQLDPADLETAHQTLTSAERSFEKDGDSPETKDIAYAAQRRAEIADAKGRTAAANQQDRQAVAEMQSTRDSQAQVTAQQLTQARQQIATQGQQLQGESQQLKDAEQRAAQTSAELAHVASVKNDSRGMVITLSGAVLFVTGESTLLPQARSKLTEVATVLTQEDKSAKIRIEGYTDSTGGQAMNERLSQDRAEAVRSFLASHGISSERMEAVGMGPANPLADNATPEGRADNRRVEIILQHPNGRLGSSPSTTPRSTTP
jgi:outer membrane protein OmpA-like peptidoglycan-associated protein